MLDLNMGQAFNAAAFVYNNNLLNENGQPITFKRHKFLIDFYTDCSPQIVAEKCLSPETRILTADLRWIKLEDAEIGQELVSVDENVAPHTSRKLRVAVVLDKNESEKEAFRITLEDGRQIVATGDHRFLCNRNIYGKLSETKWKHVNKMQVGENFRNVVTPWEDGSYEDGWFGGFIDGEGSLRARQEGGTELSLTQVNNGVLVRGKRYLQERGIAYSTSLKRKEWGKKDVFDIRISLLRDIFKIIGKTRPSRFVDKNFWEGKNLPNMSRISKNNINSSSWVKVINIEPVGVKRVIDITTTTGTFIAEGFISHNCSQVGFSTAAIIKSYHLSYYRKANIIYLLPSRSIVKDFVLPKVDPLVSTNPVLKGMRGATDNLGLKSIGAGSDQRFVYFRSSWDESSGIAISAHVLIADEYDRSNIKAVNTYRTRLDAALLDRPDLGWDWRFSNPTIDGKGVDELYQQSDQKKWMVKCSRCNYHQVLAFPDNINMKDECYICVKCERPMDDRDRIRGQWVKTFLGRDISGYRISQLMAPWVPVKKIIRDSQGDQSIFHNFTLGLPYTSKDIVITREAITKCLYPTQNPMTDVAIGVDNGIKKHYVVGNKYGIFRMGVTDDWQEIENMRNQYDAYMVCDSNPYPTPVMNLVNKYNGKVFAHFYSEDTKENDIIHWGEGDKRGIVKSDRTKIIDSVVADINSQDLLFNMSLTDLENAEYIKHCMNEYRIVEESAKGINRGVWRVIEGKPDHLLHATVLFKVALQQTLSRGMVAHTPPPNANRHGQSTVYAKPDGTVISGFDFNKLKASLDRPRRKVL